MMVCSVKQYSIRSEVNIIKSPLMQDIHCKRNGCVCSTCNYCNRCSRQVERLVFMNASVE